MWIKSYLQTPALLEGTNTVEGFPLDIFSLLLLKHTALFLTHKTHCPFQISLTITLFTPEGSTAGSFDYSSILTKQIN